MPEVPAPVTRPGDLWLLGGNRLLCGDAFDLASHRQLVTHRPNAILTDPPYGIKLDVRYKDGAGKGLLGLRSTNYERAIRGDEVAFDAAPIRAMYADVKEQFWWGGNYYRRSLSPSDLDGSWLVWDKRVKGDAAMWGSKFELCWSSVSHGNEMLRFHWAGYTATNFSLGLRREHPAEKSVPLLVEICRRWIVEAGVILDPFAGVGTTLVAAHMTGRLTQLMEIDPSYCDIICRRFQKLTGTPPILESTGEVHDFGESTQPSRVRDRVAA